MFEIRAESELGVCLFRKYKPHIVGTHIYIMQTMKHTDDDDAKLKFLSQIYVRREYGRLS